MRVPALLALLVLVLPAVADGGGPAPAPAPSLGPIPLCVEGLAPRAVDRAVTWWGDHGVDFVLVPPSAAVPAYNCVPVYLVPELAEYGLRGLTVLDPGAVPVVGVAKARDAIAIAHELGHVVYGPEHDERPGHVMSSPRVGWRR